MLEFPEYSHSIITIYRTTKQRIPSYVGSTNLYNYQDKYSIYIYTYVIFQDMTNIYIYIYYIIIYDFSMFINIQYNII